MQQRQRDGQARGASECVAENAGEHAGVVECVVRVGLGDTPVVGQRGEAEAVDAEVQELGEFDGAQH